MKDELRSQVIPDPGWRIALGIVAAVLGLFCELASTPFNSAGAWGAFFLYVSSTSFLWAIILRYLAAIEAKLLYLVLQPSPGEPPLELGAFRE